MSQADALLNSLEEEGISLQLADATTEPHIVIGADRVISVPKELQRIAVQYDHNVETVTFDCPRYWDDLDMSKLNIYINYMRKDRELGCYKATDITVDETDQSIMHFNWTISQNVSLVKGELKFLVCIKKADADGNEENHWNSELNSEMYISEGLEVDKVVLEPYPDVISQWEDEVQEVKDILLAARDAGEFDGPAGADGYSPRILVREIDGGRQLIITDVSGSQTVTILDGEDGANGADGYSPAILVREIEGGRELIITDSRQSQTVTILDGVDGTNGTDGADGADGYSPVILVRTVTGGHELVITDSRQSQTVAVMDGTDGKDGADGADGADGVSPTVSVTDISGGHRVTITDKNGTKSFDVMDGDSGAEGMTMYVGTTQPTSGPVLWFDTTE